MMKYIQIVDYDEIDYERWLCWNRLVWLLLIIYDDFDDYDQWLQWWWLQYIGGDDEIWGEWSCLIVYAVIQKSPNMDEWTATLIVKRYKK